ncbi:MAG: citramalate synthase [Dehalococcoidia bacterium]|nr:citramalate synthase [Dehalococcoidia bacterium]
MDPAIRIYDTTLRDGAQGEGVSFSVEDKLQIVRKLDELGVSYVEGGWPGSNPKDAEFFRRARSLSLVQATLTSFGSTCRPKGDPETDSNLLALVDSGASAAAIVGKSWDLHVTQVLETTLAENLRIIRESVAFLKSKGLTVFYDAEHFFDGFKANSAYALRTLEAAAGGGADWIVLCDTNGGSLPDQVSQICRRAREAVATPLGIHAHNDGELAVANSLAAVGSGVTQVQGTINGYGERCGNANLCSIIPDLTIKMGLPCLSGGQLSRLAETSRYVSELANLSHNHQLPYVGASAFAHKGGLHVAATMKCEESYQHIDPALVGNSRRVLVSELSGQGNIAYKAKEWGLASLPKARARAVLAQLKDLESKGFQFEGAEASFQLLLLRSQETYKPPFELVDFLVVVEKHRRPARRGEEALSEAMVKVRVGGEEVHTAAEGNGPVNALDLALRKALSQFYPAVNQVSLSDYKVRILNEGAGTEALIRVLIESRAGDDVWNTVGSSTNVIEASWLALVDSLEYWLLTKNAP